jgi:hypothetical protein
LAGEDAGERRWHSRDGALASARNPARGVAKLDHLRTGGALLEPRGEARGAGRWQELAEGRARGGNGGSVEHARARVGRGLLCIDGK